MNPVKFTLFCVVLLVVLLCDHSGVLGLKRGLSHYPTTTAKTATAIPVDRVYLAFTNDTTTQISVMFHTPTMPLITSMYTPMVKYGTVSGKYDQQVVGGESQTYYKPAGYSHWVVLTNLKPSTTYFYQCGSEKYGFSEEFTFKTAPKNQTTNAAYSIIIYGDLGIHNSDNTVKRVQNRVLSNAKVDNLYQFVYHVGDISYADSASITKPKQEFEYVWSKWFSDVKTIAASAAYMVCPGNHEYNKLSQCPLYSTDFKVYNSVFRRPDFSQRKRPHSMWYSFDYAGIHFVSISTETDYPGQPKPTKFGDQLSWLKEDLRRANQNRAKNPWLIVVGHRPIYSSHNSFSKNSKPINDAKILQDVLEEMFHENGVDMYFAGHVHSYERTYPVYKSQVFPSYDNPKAPVYIVAGAAGNLEGLTSGSSFYNSTYRAHIHYSDEGYGILTTEYPSTSSKSSVLKLKWQYFRSGDDGLEDEVVVSKTI